MLIAICTGALSIWVKAMTAHTTVYTMVPITRTFFLEWNTLSASIPARKHPMAKPTAGIMNTSEVSNVNIPLLL